MLTSGLKMDGDLDVYLSALVQENDAAKAPKKKATRTKRTRLDVPSYLEVDGADAQHLSCILRCEVAKFPTRLITVPSSQKGPEQTTVLTDHWASVILHCVDQRLQNSRLCLADLTKTNLATALCRYAKVPEDNTRDAARMLLLKLREFVGEERAKKMPKVALAHEQDELSLLPHSFHAAKLPRTVADSSESKSLHSSTTEHASDQ